MFKKIFAIILSFSILSGCTSCSRWTVESAVTSDGSDGSLNTISAINSTAADDNDFTDVTTENNQPPEDISSDDIAALIDKNLDIIMKDTEYFKTKDEYKDINSDEFAEIVALGEEALPYLSEISVIWYTHSDQYKQYRCIVAMAAEYAIKPELYDLVYPSPDGKYAIKASVYSFFDLLDPFMGISYCNVRLVKCATDSVIAVADANFTDFYTNFGVEWSPDNRYAAISQGHMRYYQTMAVFDVPNARFIILPYEEIADILREKLSYSDSISFYYMFHLRFNEWIDSDKIKIEILIRIGDAAGNNLIGWYVYDLKEGKILDLEYEIEYH